jgi:hypothetical protein
MRLYEHMTDEAPALTALAKGHALCDNQHWDLEDMQERVSTYYTSCIVLSSMLDDTLPMV